MKFFKKQKKFNTDLNTAFVLEFSSSSVKVLLCDYQPEKLVVLDGSKLKLTDDIVSPTGSLKIDRTASALKELIDGLREKHPDKQAYSAIAGIATPAVEGYTSQINYRRASQDPIAKNEFKTMLERVEQRADQIMRKMIDWEIAQNDGIALVNSDILEMALDGYPIDSPVGSTGEKLSSTIYNGYAQTHTARSIGAVVGKLGLQLISMTPTMYAVMRMALESKDTRENLCFLDVGDQATHIGFVQEGRILGHVSIDLAGHTFTRSIADQLGKDVQEAEALKLGFSGGVLKPSMRDDVHELVDNDCKVFATAVELVLQEFPGLKQFPSTFYLLGGGSILPGIMSTISGAEWSVKLERPKTVRAEQLLPQSVPHIEDASGKLNSPADTPILAVAFDASDLMNQNS